MSVPEGAPFCPSCGCEGCAPSDPARAGRFSGIVRRCHADERAANITMLYGRGFSRERIMAVARCSRRTFYRALRRYPDGCATNVNTPEPEHGEQETPSVVVEEAPQPVAVERKPYVRPSWETAREREYRRIERRRKAGGMLILSERSGKAYDADVLTGRCTCPASRFRPWKSCRHVKALSEHNRREAEKKGASWPTSCYDGRVLCLLTCHAHLPS